MGSRQKRKANMLPAAHYEAAGTSAYLDPNTGPRRENGKIVPRHLLVFHTPEEKVIHLTVEYTVRIGDIYKQIEECVGYAVYLQQTDKKNNTVVLDQDEIAEDGMNFGYSVQVKRRTPKLESYFQTKAVRSWACRLHEIPGVLRAGAPKEPDPPADDKGKEAKEPDPPADEAESDGEPRRKKRHDRPIPEWAPRGVPGAYFTAQLPAKKDEDCNLLPAEYQDVYWHHGM
jgi:hypothetical protein